MDARFYWRWTFGLKPSCDFCLTPSCTFKMLYSDTTTWYGLFWCILILIFLFVIIQTMPRFSILFFFFLQKSLHCPKSSHIRWAPSRCTVCETSSEVHPSSRGLRLHAHCKIAYREIVKTSITPYKKVHLCVLLFLLLDVEVICLDLCVDAAFSLGCPVLVH